MSELKIDDPVIWTRTIPGGYGYVSRVPGLVGRIHDKLIAIAVLDQNGERVIRLVQPTSVQPAGPDDPRIQAHDWGWELYVPARGSPGCDRLQRIVEASLTLPGWKESVDTARPVA